MSDFSLFALFTAGLASLAAARTVARAGPPSEGAILSPGLGERVPAGASYTIKWEPTCKGPVSLVLLRGPSTDIKPLPPAIAEGIPDSGAYAWPVPATLEDDVSHYGIQIICDSTGAYQCEWKHYIECIVFIVMTLFVCFGYTDRCWEGISLNYFSTD